MLSTPTPAVTVSTVYAMVGFIFFYQKVELVL
jgi:hypothetical protein